jgi:RNA polymerase sigma factor (sigma-70 family)
MTTNDRLKYEYFYGLIERHKALIERLCMRRSSGDSYHCAELRQECYITIWKHEKQISTDISPLQETLWVYWLCRSAFSRLRFLHRTHLYIPLDENMADTIANPDDPSMLRDYIESLSSVLNPHERRAVELMAEGYTPDEMARELGIKPHSAVQLRYRIIAKLRQYYRPDNNK